MESRAQQLKSRVILLRIILISFLIVIVSMPSTQSPVPRKMMRRGKRSFASLKCLGAYDRSKFANLNHICDECYQLYRDQTIHVACREDCFRNDIFFGCVDALLLSHEHKSLKEMINHINGRK